jgi:short-subunit dehydrogenase
MSKFVLEAFSDSLRRELHPWRIHVCLVEPGAIATPIWEKGIERAGRLFYSFPEEKRRFYAPGVNAVRAAAVQMSEAAIPVDRVAKVVHHALTATKPRTRYLVGKDAKLTARLAWLLPDRAMDWLIRTWKGM